MPSREPLCDPCEEMELGLLYNGVKRAFREADIPTPDLDARLLITETLGVSTAQLIANPRLPIAGDLATELHRRARQRLSGQSIGRILGRRAFWSLDLRVTPDVLEPRPETETVVELALAALQPADAAWRVADLGVGTGAILLAILSERHNALGIGVDISAAALREAARNAERHQLADRAHFVRGNFGAPLARAFDVVVSNPPYIATAEIETLALTVRDYDPHLALDGGADGLDAYRVVFAQARTMLKPGGHLVVEIAPDARAAVLAVAASEGLATVRVADDLSGAARAVAFRADAD